MERCRDHVQGIKQPAVAGKESRKFAFLVHLRSYREDLKHIARPLGWLPDQFYHFTLGKRPLRPFLWSDVAIGADGDEASGSIIMVPYSGRQLLERPRQMLPIVQDAVDLAVSKGATMIGLGGLISPVTLGGKLVAGRATYGVTNGNAFTAVTIFRRLQRLLDDFCGFRPTIAVVGATGSVGSLLCKMLAAQERDARYLLVARNARKLDSFCHEVSRQYTSVSMSTSVRMDDVRNADIVVLVTSDAGSLLNPSHLRENCIVLDATQPRNASRLITTLRSDIQLIDGGLVSVPSLRTNKIGRLGLPSGISFACMAETMLLSLSGHNADFSIGNPGLEHAEAIGQMARKHDHLGFKTAEDHTFGKPQMVRLPEMVC